MQWYSIELCPINSLFFLLFLCCRDDSGHITSPLLYVLPYLAVRPSLHPLPSPPLPPSLSPSLPPSTFSFRQSSHLSCGLPRFCDLLVSLSQIFSTIFHSDPVSSPSNPALMFCQLNKPLFKFIFLDVLFSFSAIFLHQLFS